MSRTRSRVGWAAGLLTSILAVDLLPGAPAHAVAGPAPAPGYGFVAKVDAGGRGCTGALINAWWVITAAGCFTDPGQTLQAGPPARAATVTVGRPDLTTATGHTVAITTLVPRTDRDLVLARLATAVTDVTPVALATTPAATGQTLAVAGYGRTATEWVPDTQHAARFTVQGTTATTFDLAGTTADAAICKGDAGGPALRDAGGRPELVGLNHTSWQHGCYTETESRQGATETRTDDLAGWITQAARIPVPGDFNDDGKADLGLFYDYGGGHVTTFTLAAHANGDGGFNGPTTAWNGPTWGGGTRFTAKGDFNGDGRTDIALFYDYGGRVAIVTLTAHPNGDGGFDGPYLRWDAPTWGSGTGFMSTGDFNGDGKTDIALFYDYGGGHEAVFTLTAHPNGDGGFNGPTSAWNGPTWGGGTRFVTTGDFNGDGKTDIALFYDYGGGHEAIFTAHSNGDGGLNAPAIRWDAPTWGSGTKFMTTGDFNGDGKTDIALFYDYGNGHEAVFTLTAHPNGDGGFNAPTIRWDAPTWGSGTQFTTTGDFNGDGKTDIALFYDYGGGHEAVFTLTAHPNGDGGFNAPTIRWDAPTWGLGTRSMF